MLWHTLWSDTWDGSSIRSACRGVKIRGIKANQKSSKGKRAERSLDIRAQTKIWAPRFKTYTRAALGSTGCALARAKSGIL